MKFLLATKKEMSQIFSSDGTVTPVTILKVFKCQVSALKSVKKDGYTAVQLELYRASKPKKAALVKEVKVDDLDQYSVGLELSVDSFEVGNKVKATAISKGKGFQGVVKRHGFSGSPATHGHKDQLRMPGSIGATDAARVFKGTRMGGQMGSKQITALNLEVVKVDAEKSEIYLKGAVPGPCNGSVVLKTV